MTSLTSDNSPKKKYESIHRYILDLIEKRKLKTGDYLPTEKELAELFKTSKNPVRTATQKLVDAGIIERIAGRGTIIKKDLSHKTTTGKIGVLYTHSDTAFFTSPYYGSILSGIGHQAEKMEQSFVFRNIRSEMNDPNIDYILSILDDVDGAILIDPQPRIYDALKKYNHQLTKPIIALGYDGDNNLINSVVTDNHNNTRCLVQYLIDQGHKQIAALYYKSPFLVKPPDNFLIRMAAYRETMWINNLDPLTKSNVCLTDLQDINQFKNALFPKKNAPTAVFLVGSVIAQPLYKAMNKLGKKIPDDLSVASYDRLGAQHLNPLPVANDTSLMQLGIIGVKRIIEMSRESPLEPVSPIKSVISGTLLEGLSIKKID